MGEPRLKKTRAAVKIKTGERIINKTSAKDLSKIVLSM